MGVSTLISLLACLGTWNTSRAKKIRLMEDAILSAVRALRERADAVDVKQGESQVTIAAMLAETQEFFDRSVKERKRATVAESRVAAAAASGGNAEGFALMSRSDQIDALRGHFEGR